VKCAVIVPEPFRHDEAETCRQLSSSDFTRRLEFLRADHERVYGRPFEHFYCPLLFRDEPVKLAKGHVYPQAFTGTDRKWTVQRKDVESWFGSMFEADFVQLELRGHPSFLDAALEDPKRAKQLQLRFALMVKRCRTIGNEATFRFRRIIHPSLSRQVRRRSH